MSSTDDRHRTKHNPLSLELMTGDCRLTTAISAAAEPKLHAVAFTEPSAECVQFQRHQPNHPPQKILNSAASSRISAVQFGGSTAICAISAAFAAYSAF